MRAFRSILFCLSPYGIVGPIIIKSDGLNIDLKIGKGYWKNFLRDLHLWVGRRCELILCCILKIDGKNNSGCRGLMKKLAGKIS